MSLFQFLHGKPVTIQGLDAVIANLQSQLADKSEEIERLRADLPAQVIEHGNVSRVASTLASIERERDALVVTRAELERKKTELQDAEQAEAAKLELALKAELGAKAAAIATRLRAKLDDAASDFTELVSILDRFSEAPPQRNNDYPPIANLAALRLWAKTGGLVGRAAMVSPDEVLTNDNADLVHAVKEFVELAITTPAQRPASPEQSESSANSA
jgi:hypothetical protein